MSATQAIGSEPPHKGGRLGVALRSFFSPAAVFAILVTAAASWASWTAVGDACINSTTLDRGSPAGAICELEVANWHASGVGTASLGDRLHEDFMLALPIAMVLGGIAVAAIRKRRRFFWVAALIAVATRLAPLIGVVLLPGT
jgi:hypothetical protein